MIGIMNCGDESVEFYATARQSSLYKQPPPKSHRTYSAAGRVFIDGVPEYNEVPEKMWQDVMSKMYAMRVMKTMDSQTGPMAAIRRISTKLKLRKSLSAASDEPILMADLHRERSLSPRRAQGISLSRPTNLLPSTPERADLQPCRPQLPSALSSPVDAPTSLAQVTMSSPIELIRTAPNTHVTTIVIDNTQLTPRQQEHKVPYELSRSKKRSDADSGRESMRSEVCNDEMPDYEGTTVLRF